MRTLILFFIIVLLSSNMVLAQENAYPLKSSIWEETQIPVCWENGTEQNKRERELVRQAVKETWEKYSALEFTEWCPCRENMKGIRIKIEDTGPHTKGLGNNLDGKKDGMVLNFTFQKWSRSCRFDKDFCIKAIAAHEFGHAIGFAHEQNRDDCNFPDCLGREQGTDGDWYITRCDSNSIMNYCNPKWSNGGILSSLDIEAVQKIYGLPEDKMNEYKGLQIVHTSRKIGKAIKNKAWYEFKVYISGSESDLANVDKVVYKLHKTFKNPEMVSNNHSSNFGIGLKVWGEFEIIADVHKKDGTVVTLKRYLNF